jgi:hypothetical protein
MLLDDRDLEAGRGRLASNLSSDAWDGHLRQLDELDVATA